MKKLFYTLCVLLPLSGIAASEQLPAPKSSVEPINRIVAVVNTTIITQSELDRSMQATLFQFQRQGIPLPSTKILQKKTLDMLIDQKLQLMIAEQNHVTTSKSQVNEAIKQIAERNHATVEELKQKLHSDGITFDEFKQQTQEQLTVMRLEQQVLAGKIDLSTAKVNAFKAKLDQENQTTSYHVVDYLIPEDDKEKALQLEKMLHKGGQVADLKGVEVQQLGWRNLDEIPDVFATRVVNMQDNEVSEPILTGNGYHVIQLLGTRKTNDNVSAQQARQLLYAKQFQRALKEWLQTLRNNAYIKIYIDDN